MPQILAHHQSSTMTPTISSVKVPSNSGSEAEKIIVGTVNSPSPSN